MEYVDFFDDLKNRYVEFSNFAKTKIEIDGVVYPTTEHYFHAMKFSSQDFGEGTPSLESSQEDREWYISKIIESSTPNKAKILGNQKLSGRFSATYTLGTHDKTLLSDIVKQSIEKNINIRSDWDKIKLKVMYKAVKAKFDQHKDLKKLLLSTGDKLIREVSPYDSYWGIGKDKNGQNRLGVILMKIRTEYMVENPTDDNEQIARVKQLFNEGKSWKKIRKALKKEFPKRISKKKTQEIIDYLSGAKLLKPGQIPVTDLNEEEQFAFVKKVLDKQSLKNTSTWKLYEMLQKTFNPVIPRDTYDNYIDNYIPIEKKETPSEKISEDLILIQKDEIRKIIKQQKEDLPSFTLKKLYKMMKEKFGKDTMSKNSIKMYVQDLLVNLTKKFQSGIKKGDVVEIQQMYFEAPPEYGLAEEQLKPLRVKQPKSGWETEAAAKDSYGDTKEPDEEVEEKQDFKYIDKKNISIEEDLEYKFQEVDIFENPYFAQIARNFGFATEKKLVPIEYKRKVDNTKVIGKVTGIRKKKVGAFDVLLPIREYEEIKIIGENLDKSKFLPRDSSENIVDSFNNVLFRKEGDVGRDLALKGSDSTILFESKHITEEDVLNAPVSDDVRTKTRNLLFEHLAKIKPSLITKESSKAAIVKNSTSGVEYPTILEAPLKRFDIYYYDEFKMWYWARMHHKVVDMVDIEMIKEATEKKIQQDNDPANLIKELAKRNKGILKGTDLDAINILLEKEKNFNITDPSKNMNVFETILLHELQRQYEERSIEIEKNLENGIGTQFVADDTDFYNYIPNVKDQFLDKIKRTKININEGMEPVSKTVYQVDYARVLTSIVSKYLRLHSKTFDVEYKIMFDKEMIVQFSTLTPTEYDRTIFENDYLNILNESYNKYSEDYNKALESVKVALVKAGQSTSIIQDAISSDEGNLFMSKITEFESVVFRNSKNTEDYIHDCLTPVLFLDTVGLGEYASFFKAKIVSQEFDVAKLYEATLAHYIPEMMMHKNIRESEHWTRAENTLIDCLDYHKRIFVDSYIQTYDKFRKKRRFIEVPFIDRNLFVSPKERCFEDTNADEVLHIPDDKLVICLDRGTYTCHNSDEVMSNYLQGNTINKLTNREFPHEFIRKLRTRQSELLFGEDLVQEFELKELEDAIRNNKYLSGLSNSSALKKIGYDSSEISYLLREGRKDQLKIAINVVNKYIEKNGRGKLKEISEESDDEKYNSGPEYANSSESETSEEESDSEGRH